MSEKLILAVNNKTAACVKETAKQLVELRQSVVVGFKKLKIGEIESISQLEKVLTSPEDFIKNRMVDVAGGKATVGGMKLNRSKLLELIELPQAAIKYIEFVKQISAEIEDKTSWCRNQTAVNLKNFEIAAGAVVSSEQQKAVIEAAGVIYADNQRQIDFYNQIESVLAEVEKLNKNCRSLLAISSPQTFVLSSGFVHIDHETHKMAANPHVIKDRVK